MQVMDCCHVLDGVTLLFKEQVHNSGMFLGPELLLEFQVAATVLGGIA